MSIYNLLQALSGGYTSYNAPDRTYQRQNYSAKRAYTAQPSFSSNDLWGALLSSLLGQWQSASDSSALLTKPAAQRVQLQQPYMAPSSATRIATGQRTFNQTGVTRTSNRTYSNSTQPASSTEQTQTVADSEPKPRASYPTVKVWGLIPHECKTTKDFFFLGPKGYMNSEEIAEIGGADNTLTQAKLNQHGISLICADGSKYQLKGTIDVVLGYDNSRGFGCYEPLSGVGMGLSWTLPKGAMNNPRYA